MARPSSNRSLISPFTLFERLFRFEQSFGDAKAAKPVRLGLTALEDRLVPEGRPLPHPMLFTASGYGDTPMVNVYDAESGNNKFSVQPFGSEFQGGHSVASADFDNDTVPDLLVAAGKGGGPRVRLYSGKTGQAITGHPLADYWAYESTFTGGVEAAAGDVDGDGRMDAVTVAMTGGGPRVRAFSGANGEVLADFFAYDSNFKGGLHVAMGDFNIDGKDEIVVAAGKGGGPRVSIFTPDGEMLEHKLKDFFAFDPEDRSGVYLAVGDVNGDTLPDIITGSGAGAVSTVRVYNGRDGSRMVDRQVNGPEDTMGVRVASSWINDDRYSDLVTASGPGGSKVKVFAAGTEYLAGMPLDHFAPFEEVEGGVMIAAANDPGAGTSTVTPAALNASIERGQMFEVKATVVSTNTSFTPSGTVNFYASNGVDMVPVGSGTLSNTGAPNSYTSYALLSVKDVTLPDDSYDVVADYLGDVNLASEVGTATAALASATTSSLPIAMPSDPTSCPVENLVEQAQGGPLGVSPVTRGGVLAVDGSITLEMKELGGHGFGTPWGLTWLWSNSAGVATDEAGTGTRLGPVPKMVQVDGTDSFAVQLGSQTYFFDKLDGVYVARFAVDFKLVQDSGRYIFTDGRGNRFFFYDWTYGTTALRGCLEKYIDAGGNQIDATWSGGQLTEITRTETDPKLSDTITESLLYVYLTSGANSGKVDTVTLRRKIGSGSYTTVRSMDYEYYDGGQTYGPSGCLQKAILKDSGGTAIDTRYYRYYTSNTAPGYTGGLQYAFGARAYDRLVQALGSSVDSLTDGQVDDYADHYLEYDSSQRVTKHVVSGEGCSACSGGQGEYTYDYAESAFIGGSNIWRFKTTETLPDGAINVYYLNANGQMMLERNYIKTDFSKIDGDVPVFNNFFQQYDSSGRVVMTANQSAIGKFSVEAPTTEPDEIADLMNDTGGNYASIQNSGGLVTVFDYADTTTADTSDPGDVAGYLQSVAIRRGETGTDVPQADFTYIGRTANSQTHYFPASTTRYRETNGTGDQTTEYTYQWHSGTALPSEIVTTLPTVTTAQNGPDYATATAVQYDKHGWPTKTYDAASIVTTYDYDLATGALIESVRDTATLKLADVYEVDALGRATKHTSPNGRVDYTVYKDTDQEVRFYPAWDTGTDAPTGPTIVSRHDRGYGYTETISITEPPALTSSKPNGTETFTWQDIVALSRSVQNAAGQTVYSDAYHDLDSITYSESSVTLGSVNTNYLRTELVYGQHAGLRNKVVSPAGTITRTEYDKLGRPSSLWIGTDDTPTTGFWSVTNTAGTNMTKVREYEFDGGSTGDSNLTKSTELPGGGAANRVTQPYYDWRNRTVAVKAGVEGSENTGVNRPISYLVYDNLSQTIESRMYDGDAVSITSTSGVPNAPSSGLLRAKSVSSFDELGRVYKTQTYSVYLCRAELWSHLLPNCGCRDLACFAA